MALVSYSDSEGSESESEQKIQSARKEVSTPATSSQPKPSKPAPGGFQSLVDRSNPRKLRVALPEIKPETKDDGTGEEDGGPARKKARIGGGGAFSGFNSLLPPPKRSTQGAGQDKKPGASTRKVFSLKTGATPGFDRAADAEMRQEQALNAGAGADDESIPTAGSLRDGPTEPAPPKEEPKKIGNAMMFKPLSVARNTQKKKTSAAASRAVDGAKAVAAKPIIEPEEQPTAVSQPAPPQPKPKVSLFSIASEERTTAPDVTAGTTGTYQPLVYTTDLDETPAGPQSQPSELEPQQVSDGQSASATSKSQTLDDIANDLNLSRAERRQLMGRQSAASQSRILNFNTDVEYAANQAFLSQASEAELAAKQHNPVRSIAPGKHSLQQLVNVANSQRDALEESFAAGRRNKKEAGSRYGW